MHRNHKLISVLFLIIVSHMSYKENQDVSVPYTALL